MNVESSARTALNLYRRLLRYGQQLQLTEKSYYNRRIRSEFRRNRAETDPTAVQFCLQVNAHLHSLDEVDLQHLHPTPERRSCPHQSQSSLIMTTHFVRSLLTSIVPARFAPLLLRRPFVSKSISHIDRTLVPQLAENELEEQFVRGSGPGGQATNKTANAVVLRHVPTNIVVKCHAGRALAQNRKEARRIMQIRLDNLYNGEQSVEQQMVRLGQQKMAETTRRRRKVDEMKRTWREREGKDE